MCSLLDVFINDGIGGGRLEEEDGADSERLPDTSLSADQLTNLFSIQFDSNFLRPQNTNNVFVHSAYNHTV